MNICLLKGSLKKKGGLEKQAHRIALAFAERGARVTFLTMEPSTLEGPFSVEPLSVPRFPSFWKLEQYDRAVQKWLKQHPMDLVFGMERNRIQTHLRAGNGVHAAYLQSRLASEGKWKFRMCQINPLHRKILSLEKAAFESPSLQKLFVNSEMVRNEVLQYYRTDPKKIVVLHNGVEWEEWSAGFDSWEEGKKQMLKEWNLPQESLHLLFIGHGYRRKGLDPLLEALALWENREVHLSVVGKDKEMDRYRKKIARLGLENQVRLFGPQKEILPFYQLADLLVIPSFYDPFANVTVEALAMGLFVVSSKHNGGHEILTQENGAITHALTPCSILTALKKGPFKTQLSAVKIRNKTRPFDFSYQLPKLMAHCV